MAPSIRLQNDITWMHDSLKVWGAKLASLRQTCLTVAYTMVKLSRKHNSPVCMLYH